jgi:hypothetical protein
VLVGRSFELACAVQSSIQVHIIHARAAFSIRGSRHIDFKPIIAGKLLFSSFALKWFVLNIATEFGVGATIAETCGGNGVLQTPDPWKTTLNISFPFVHD